MKRVKIVGIIVFALLFSFILLPGCTQPQIVEPPRTGHSNAPVSEADPEILMGMPPYDVSGKYVCSSELYNTDIEFFAQRPELLPFITFYEDGKCIFGINYAGDFCDVNGIYSIEGGDSVIIDLDFENTVFIDTETSETYIPMQYTFKIVNDDEIIIDKDCYGVHAEDSFFRE